MLKSTPFYRLGLSMEFMGLPPYRDSLTQLMVHSLYQSLLLHHQQRMEKSASCTAVELECRLGQLTPKHHLKLLQQDGYKHVGTGAARNEGSGGGGSQHHAAVGSSNILTSVPVTTPAVLHHKAQYQCRFDVGVSSPSLQRLEYLLQIPNRRPPHVLPRGEVPLRGVRSTTLPPLLTVHGSDLSRYQFVIEKKVGERVVRFHSAQKKALAFQSDVLCPNWSTDMRLSVAVEHVSRGNHSTSLGGASSASPQTLSAWPKSVSSIFSHTQRSRSTLGRYLWVDIAVVQAMPYHCAAQASRSDISSSDLAHSIIGQLQHLYEHPASVCRLDTLRGLSVALAARQRLRKVELEVNIPQLYADWKDLSRYALRTRADSQMHRFATRGRRERYPKSRNDAGEPPRVPPIPKSLYSHHLNEALQMGNSGAGSCSYPSLFETDIHTPIEFGGRSSSSVTDQYTRGREKAFLYGVAQQILTAMQFLAAGAQH